MSNIIYFKLKATNNIKLKKKLPCLQLKIISNIELKRKTLIKRYLPSDTHRLFLIFFLYVIKCSILPVF